MTVQVSMYRTGLETLAPDEWAALTTLEAVLIEGGTGWTFDASQVSLTSMSLGTTELTATNAARIPLTPGTPTYSAGVWTLPLGAEVLAALGTAEEIDAVVVYLAGVDDAASVPVWAVHDSVPGTAIATCDGTGMTVALGLTVS